MDTEARFKEIAEELERLSYYDNPKVASALASRLLIEALDDIVALIASPYLDDIRNNYRKIRQDWII